MKNRRLYQAPARVPVETAVCRAIRVLRIPVLAVLAMARFTTMPPDRLHTDQHHAPREAGRTESLCRVKIPTLTRRMRRKRHGMSSTESENPEMTSLHRPSPHSQPRDLGSLPTRAQSTHMMHRATYPSTKAISLA